MEQVVQVHLDIEEVIYVGNDCHVEVLLSLPTYCIINSRTGITQRLSFVRSACLNCSHARYLPDSNKLEYSRHAASIDSNEQVHDME